MKNPNKIGHPLFLLSITLLILNDWVFKNAFHNELTGKLSDFAGLFAFPFLFSVLFPRKKRFVHIITAIGFLYWNSPLSQSFIVFFNHWNIPINRTIDYTDNIALLSIILSYVVLKSDYFLPLPSTVKRVFIVLSCTAFLATSLPLRMVREYVIIDKTYQFDVSREHVINKLNLIQVELIKKHYYNNPNIFFDEEKNIFYYGGKEGQQPYLRVDGSLNTLDTLALLIDVEKARDLDTVYLKNAFMEIEISGDDSKSEIKLTRLYKAVKRFSDKDYKDKAIKEFEKEVVKKIQY